MRTKLSLIVVVFGLCLGVPAAAQDRPAALIALENGRSAMLTGRVDWSIKSARPDDAFSKRTFYSSRFAGDEYIEELRGDSAGMTRPVPPNGEPYRGYSKRRHYKLRMGGDQWQHWGREVGAEIIRGENDVRDVRILGIRTGMQMGMDHVRSLRMGGEWRFEDRIVDGGLHEVTAVRIDSDEDWRIQYLIDPDRGWNAVRVTVLRDGKMFKESLTKLEQFGDTWFPSEVRCFDSSYEQGRVPLLEISIHKAEFNEPHHPRRLIPEDIGIEIGTNIHVQNKKREPITISGWDGDALIPIKKLLERILSGELRQGPAFREEVERSLAEGRGLENQLNQWKRYTERFIKKYQLNRAQSTRALTILKDCQERGNAHIRRKAQDTERVRQSVFEVLQATSSEAVRSDKMAELKAAMSRIQYPLWKIYRKELIPRLEKLPTRAQRSAAEK